MAVVYQEVSYIKKDRRGNDTIVIIPGYHHAIYSGLEVIVNKVGDFNLTKICSMYIDDDDEDEEDENEEESADETIQTKRFVDWRDTKKNKRRVNRFKALYASEGGNPDKVMYEVKGHNLIKGTYGITELAIEVASWVDDDFAWKMHKISKDYIQRETNRQIAALTGRNTDLESKIEIMRVEQREANRLAQERHDAAIARADQAIAQNNQLLSQNANLTAHVVNVETQNTTLITQNVQTHQMLDQTQEMLAMTHETLEQNIAHIQARAPTVNPPPANRQDDSYFGLVKLNDPTEDAPTYKVFRCRLAYIGRTIRTITGPSSDPDAVVYPDAKLFLQFGPLPNAVDFFKLMSDRYGRDVPVIVRKFINYRNYITRVNRCSDREMRRIVDEIAGEIRDFAINVVHHREHDVEEPTDIAEAEADDSDTEAEDDEE